MMDRFIALVVFFLCTTGIQAQIDRSQMPEPGPAPEINIGKPQTFTLRQWG